MRNERRFSRWRLSANLDFQSLTFVEFDCDYYRILPQRTKLSENRTIRL